MTDFEKIIKVTRRAKANADSISKAFDLKKGFSQTFLDIIGSVGNAWCDMNYIRSLFDEPRKRIIALEWYDTVFQLRLNK